MSYNRIILPQDTIENIAREINLLNPEFLVEFHNENCAKENAVISFLIPGKILHLPGKDLIEKANRVALKELENDKYNPIFKFFPDSLNGNYKTIIVEKEMNTHGKIEVVKIMYNVHLNYLVTENDLHLIEFSRTHFKSSHEGILSELALQCFERICPLFIYLNNDGLVIKIEINKEKRNHFAKIKEEIINYYKGENAGIYIDDFENVINNDSVFDQKMKQDPFIKTFFAEVRKKTQYGQSTVTMNMKGKENWSVHQKIEENSAEKIVITQCLDESVNKKSREKVYQFHGKYILNPQKYSVENCEVDFHEKFRAFEKESKLTIRKISE